MDAKEQRTLLEYAKQIVTKVVTKSNVKVPPPRGGVFEEKRGAFVTLQKHGELRGCIGLIVSDEPLWMVITEMAESSALHDPRFPAVSRKELTDISIEISVLTPFSKVKNISEIQVGVDGLMLKHGAYSGLFLPQVPTEWNWNLSDYLDNLCLKAGLPPGSHKLPGAELFKFQAEVF